MVVGLQRQRRQKWTQVATGSARTASALRATVGGQLTQRARLRRKGPRQRMLASSATSSGGSTYQGG